jgi:hypothetical protein
MLVPAMASLMTARKAGTVTTILASVNSSCLLISPGEQNTINKQVILEAT